MGRFRGEVAGPVRKKSRSACRGGLGGRPTAIADRGKARSRDLCRAGARISSVPDQPAGTPWVAEVLAWLGTPLPMSASFGRKARAIST